MPNVQKRRRLVLDQVRMISNGQRYIVIDHDPDLWKVI